MEAEKHWQQYRRIQEILLFSPRGGAMPAALEAKLNSLLQALEAGLSSSDSTLEPTNEVNTELCRERRHARLLARHIVAEPSANAERQLSARLQIAEISLRLSREDWLAISMAAQGYSFDEIASEMKVKPGALRTRVSRTRSMLRAA